MDKAFKNNCIFRSYYYCDDSSDLYSNLNFIIYIFPIITEYPKKASKEEAHTPLAIHIVLTHIYTDSSDPSPSAPQQRTTHAPSTSMLLSALVCFGCS